MADGETTLKLEVTLSESAFRHLRERAESLGVPVSTVVSRLLELQMFDYADYDWGDDPENDPRTATIEPFDPDVPTYPADEAMAEFRAELERRLAAKR